MQKQKVLGFKIWYSDKVVQGKTYQDWVDAPDQDVQCVLLFFNEIHNHQHGHLYRRIATGNNFYSLTESLELLQGNNKTKPTKGHIKTGKWTSEENYNRIHWEAFDDEGHGFVIPEKSSSFKKNGL